jgi:hypothetical protein
MKFKCPKCKTVIKRDMRIQSNKFLLTKKGNYKTWCNEAMTIVYCKPIKKFKNKNKEFINAKKRKTKKK